MSIKGNIKDLSLIDFLQIVSQNQKSGILYVNSDELNAEAYFFKGKLVDVKIHDEEEKLKLGNYLMARGIISKERLDELLEKQKKTPLRFGRLLVEENVLTKEKLKNILKNFIITKLEKILSLENGQYEFKTVNVDFNEEEVDPISLDSIILDALKNIDEIKLFRKKIKNINLIYKKNIEKSDDVILGSNLKKDDFIVKKGNKYFLNNEAYFIYNMINGENSLKDIISKTSLGDHTVLKAVFQLINYGLIEQIEKDVEKKLDIDRGLFLKKIVVAIIFLALIYTLILNLHNLKLIKTNIIINREIKMESELRIKKYKEFIDEIEKLTGKKSKLYHNPDKI